VFPLTLIFTPQNLPFFDILVLFQRPADNGHFWVNFCPKSAFFYPIWGPLGGSISTGGRSSSNPTTSGLKTEDFGQRCITVGSGYCGSGADHGAPSHNKNHTPFEERLPFFTTSAPNFSQFPFHACFHPKFSSLFSLPYPPKPTLSFLSLIATFSTPNIPFINPFTSIFSHFRPFWPQIQGLRFHFSTFSHPMWICVPINAHFYPQNPPIFRHFGALSASCG